MPRRTAAVAVLAVAALLAAGCADRSGKLEDQIARSVEQQTGIKAVKVTCPGVSGKKGEQVRCEARGDFASYLRTIGVESSADRLTYLVTFTEKDTFTAVPQVDDLRASTASA